MAEGEIGERRSRIEVVVNWGIGIGTRVRTVVGTREVEEVNMCLCCEPCLLNNLRGSKGLTVEIIGLGGTRTWLAGNTFASSLSSFLSSEALPPLLNASSTLNVKSRAGNLGTDGSLSIV